MMNNLTDAIKHLIIINVILFIAPRFLGVDFSNILALHFQQNEHFGVWQYVTHMFMHASFGHILFNMYGLWAFGTPLEQMWGKNKFLFFYFSAGIGAGLIYTLVNYYQFNNIYQDLISIGISDSNISQILKISARTYGDFTQQTEEILRSSINQTKPANINDLLDINKLYNIPAVGASGAVYGILVAFGLYFKDAKLMLIFLPVPIKAKFFIPGLILMDLLLGVTNSGTGVAHFAHIGGAIIGFIIAYYWKKKQFNTY